MHKHKMALRYMEHNDSLHAPFGGDNLWGEPLWVPQNPGEKLELNSFFPLNVYCEYSLCEQHWILQWKRFV